MTRLLLAVAGLVAAVFFVGAATVAVQSSPSSTTAAVFDEPSTAAAPTSSSTTGSTSTSSSTSTTTTEPPPAVTLPATTVPPVPVTEPPVTVPEPTVPPVPDVTVPTVTAPPAASGVEQWRSLAAGYDWNVDIVLCLMAFESGGNPNAYNASSGASGLMQVLASWADNFGYAPADLFVPEVNLSISHALYVDGGWSHWSPWNRGECH